MIKIKQLTPIYDPKEDRLRLIINLNYPDRYDLWITRKFLINILDNIQNFLEKNKIKEAKNSIGSSKEVLSENNNIYPPINEVPLLLETLNISCLENNNFFIKLEDIKSNLFSCYLSREELNNLIKLIVIHTKYEWGISFL